jgi:hypothetical protein
LVLSKVIASFISVVTLFILRADSFLPFGSHQGDPSLRDLSSPILRQYGPPRDLANLGHPEAPKSQESIRAQYSSENYVVGELLGQMGNNLFQVAAASAVAWDHGAEAYFPRLSHTPILCQHIFSRCKIFPPSDEISAEWAEPGFYEPIPFTPKMKICGYLQSPQYFSHHRERLLQLFAPTQRDLKYIQKKYGCLIENPQTVGIQIRYYVEDVDGNVFTQYGKDYLSKAMALFPPSSLFIVSSNNLDFARQNVSGENVIFLEGEPHYIDFYLLSLCRGNIITNSTFGWWAAWLNQNPNKKVVCPLVWFLGCDRSDLCPKEWIQIDAKKGCIGDPESY